MSTSTTRRAQAAFAAAALVGGICLGTVTQAAAAASCPTEKGAKEQVAVLVAQLHDVSRGDRAQVRHALIRSVQTLRGKDATTKTERVTLGRQISALARTLHTADTLVARKAIITSIHALQAQKKAGRTTTAQTARLERDNAHLEKAAVSTATTRAEKKAITRQFRHIHESFTCTP